MSRIRVLIVDDHELVRRGLVSFLEMSEDIDVCGEADSGEHSLLEASKLSPDVVLMDLSMPGMGGIEATAQLKKAHPELRIIVLTSHSDEELVVKALQAGAQSYLLKTCSPERLEQAIRAANAGESTVDPAVTHILVGQMQKPQQERITEELTPREREVLYWIAQGLSNKEIADELHIGIKTVKTHVSNLLAKLSLQDRTQLAIYAHQNNLHRK